MSSRASACLLWAMYLRERGRAVRSRRTGLLSSATHPRLVTVTGDRVQAPSPTKQYLPGEGQGSQQRDQRGAGGHFQLQAQV